MSQTTRVFRIQELLNQRGHVSKRPSSKSSKFPAQFKRDLAFLRISSASRSSTCPSSGPTGWNRRRRPRHRTRRAHVLDCRNSCHAAHAGSGDTTSTGAARRAPASLASAPEHAPRARGNFVRGNPAQNPDPAHGVPPGRSSSFRKISQATLTRRRLHITYHGRSTDEITEREISPQRLVFYRGNWYVDSWCHLREDLRSFSVDAIQTVSVLLHSPQSRRRLSERPPRQRLWHLRRARHRAGRASFRAGAARWVSREVWHSRQQRVIEPSDVSFLPFPTRISGNC